MNRKFVKAIITILFILSIVSLASCANAKDIEDARKATEQDTTTENVVEDVSEITTELKSSPGTGK